MKIQIFAGDQIEVVVADSDGTFTIAYDVDGSRKLTVSADMPDTTGREGEIYCEDFSDPPNPTVIDCGSLREDIEIRQKKTVILFDDSEPDAGGILVPA